MSPEYFELLTILIPIFFGISLLIWMYLRKNASIAAASIALVLVLEGLAHLLWHSHASYGSVASEVLAWTWVVYVAVPVYVLLAYRPKPYHVLHGLMLLSLILGIYTIMNDVTACSTLPVGPHFAVHTFFSLAGFFGILVMTQSPEKS